MFGRGEKGRERGEGKGQKMIIPIQIAVLNDDTLEITELPVKTWTQGYKESVLEPMLESSDKKAAVIS